jgi:superfamily II DNA helicase RecQ
MKFQFFTFPAQAPEAGQQVLNRFCSEHRVLAVDRHFAADGGQSYWSVCVTYIEGAEALPGGPAGRRERVDYRELLSPEDFAVFAQLRDLRKRLSDQEGVPAYAVLTNEHLAELVTRRATTLAAIGEVPGIGPARVEKYGDAILGVLQRAFAAQTAPGAKALPDARGKEAG